MLLFAEYGYTVPAGLAKIENVTGIIHVHTK